MIKKKIVVYSKTEGHSFLLIEFQGEQFIADVFGENDRINKIISPVDSLRHLSKSPLIDRFSFQKKYDRDKTIEYFNDNEDFVEYLSNKPGNNIKLLFRPKIDETHYDEIEITINDESIICTVGDKSYILFVEK